MDVLDSVDVNVVFNHYMSCSLGFLTTTNGVLTSVAVLTAVLSFWKLRSFSIPPPTTEKSSPAAAQLPPDHVATETSRVSSNIDQQVPTAATYCCSSVVSSFGTIIEEENEEEEDAEIITSSSTTSSPRKFTVMYYGEVDNREDETTLFGYCTDVVYNDENATSTVEASPLLSTRKGNNNLDWYRQQDLSMLNGNVVKLWDCKKQRKNSRVSLASTSISTGIRT